MDERVLILAKQLSPQSIQEFGQLVNSFRSTFGPRGRVISVFDADMDALSSISGLERWSDVFEYRKYSELWRDAYQRAGAAIDRLSRANAAILRNFYHDIAETILRCLVVKELLDTATSPVMILVRASGVEPFRNVDARVKRLDRSSVASSVVKAGLKKVRPLYDSIIGGSRVANSDRTHSRSGTVIVSIEDTGTKVNLVPAVAILNEMRDRGLTAAVVSTRADVIEKVRSLNFAAHNLAELSLRLKPWEIALRRAKVSGELLRLLKDFAPSSGEWLYLHEIRAKVLEYAVFDANVRTVLDNIRSSSDVKALFVLNESSHLAALMTDWAKSRSIPSIGFNPILVGDRPDNKSFPAPIHCVYGEQLRSLMTSIGVPPATVHVVGSPTFDSAFHRDRERDRLTVATGILRHWSGEKLVVVGTEALPKPLVELEPVLRTLSGMSGVHVVLKVHPSDSLSFYEAVAERICGGGKIEVIKDCDVQALLAAADLLVCIISNMIVTAAILGTPTLVCDFSGKRRPLDFVEQGLSFGCFSQEQIAPMVRMLLFDPAVREQWDEMRRSKLTTFTGPGDGHSQRRIVDLIISTAADRSELCRTTA